MSTDPLARDLAAIRSRAQKRETIPSADALRLLDAVEGVLRQAEYAAGVSPFSVLPLQARGVHAREHDRWWACDCPGAIPVMWSLDPVKVREGIERELSRRPPEPGPLQDTAGAAAAAGGREG